MKRNFSRRDAVRIIGGLALCGASIRANWLWAQTPAPPAPPGLGQPQPSLDKAVKGTITLDSYETWLRAVQAAAQEAATRNGQKLTEEAARRVDDNARGVLQDKGYAVPLPPSNLTIQ